MAPRLFWIGLGNMGRGMAKNLVEKGTMDGPLLIYNRTKQRTIDLSQSLPAGKTTVMDNVADGVSQADVIFTSMSNDAAVEAIIQEILKSGSVAGKLVVETSTIHPETAERMAKAVVDAGAQYVAAPVFGAPAMADAGQLVGVLAGPKASIDRAKPFFKGVMARAEVDMTDMAYGKSLTLKIIGNTFILNMVEQLAEGHVLAEKTGLGTNYLHDFITNMFPGPFEAYSSRMMSGDYYGRDSPLFAVDLARKDAGHALALAKEAGVKMHNVETADKHLVELKKHKGEKGDLPGIYGAMRVESGLKFGNKE